MPIECYKNIRGREKGSRHLNDFGEIIVEGLPFEAHELAVQHGLAASRAPDAQYGSHVRDGNLPQFAVVNLSER